MRLISTPHTSWQALLEAPPGGSHLLQICDSQAFFVAGVGHFAASGLQRGEAVRLDGAQWQLDAVLKYLESLGVDVAEARRNGRLVLGDAEAELDGWLANGPLERPVFDGLLDAVFSAMHKDPRWTGFRWFGEFAPTMQRRGDPAAARMLEAAAGDAAARHDGVVLCAELCDPFDAGHYDHLLTLCSEHTHVIPAKDYVAHRRRVERAVGEVVGEIRGSLLQSLSTWKGLNCDVPTSQALLFWLRDVAPEKFDAVLVRAKGLEADGAA
jgi:hypothetical protein